MLIFFPWVSRPPAFLRQPLRRGPPPALSVSQPGRPVSQPHPYDRGADEVVHRRLPTKRGLAGPVQSTVRSLTVYDWVKKITHRSPGADPRR